MQERLLNQEKEKQPLLVRYHHLEIFNEMIDEYFKDFNGTKPWDLLDEYKPLVYKFAHQWAADDVKTIIFWNDKFEEMGNTQEEQKYIYDSVGFSDSERALVIEKRSKYYSDIFFRAIQNKNSLVALTIDNDPICDSCHIGKHCKRFLPAGLTFIPSDKDLIVFETIKWLFNESRLWDLFDSKKLIKERNHIYITSELLFDNDFYKRLKNGIRDRYSLNGFMYWISQGDA